SERPESQFIFTCRPQVTHDNPSVLRIPLAGLKLSETFELFKQRGAATALEDDIAEAHELTSGHAFWLDLLAVQVARRLDGVDLPRLIRDIKGGRATCTANRSSQNA